jgi:hypothetical protein
MPTGKALYGHSNKESGNALFVPGGKMSLTTTSLIISLLNAFGDIACHFGYIFPQA